MIAYSGYIYSSATPPLFDYVIFDKHLAFLLRILSYIFQARPVASIVSCKWWSPRMDDARNLHCHTIACSLFFDLVWVVSGHNRLFGPVFLRLLNIQLGLLCIFEMMTCYILDFNILGVALLTAKLEKRVNLFWISRYIDCIYNVKNCVVWLLDKV